MNVLCIFGLHRWEYRNCARCGKARSESAHEGATRRSIREAARRRRVNEVRELLRGNRHLVVGEGTIRGRFGSTPLDADAQRLVKSVAIELERAEQIKHAEQMAAKQRSVEEAVKKASPLASFDSFADRLQPSQPRDPGAMLTSRPKSPFDRW